MATPAAEAYATPRQEEVTAAPMAQAGQPPQYETPRGNQGQPTSARSQHGYYTDSATEGESDQFVSEDDADGDAGLDTARSELESAREGMRALHVADPAGAPPLPRRKKQPAAAQQSGQPFETPREFSEEEVRDAFAAFDEDGDGFLDARDVGLFFEALGERLDEAEVRALIAQVDADGDGRVSFAEFFDMANRSTFT